MNIKELKKELNINNADIAKCFDMSYNSFANSTAKERYENALLNFYKLAKKAWEKNKTKKQISDNSELSDDKAINYTRCCMGEAEQLPTKEKMEIALETLLTYKEGSFKTEYDKITFKFGFRTCFNWIEKKLNK